MGPGFFYVVFEDGNKRYFASKNVMKTSLQSSLLLGSGN